MEIITNFIFQHAFHAHWIILSGLIIAGFYIPISEDILIIIGAILASNVIPGNTYKILLCIYLGCLCSDWTVYWLGRLVGEKLRRRQWFSKKISSQRLEKAKYFYERYGFYTLVLGRFIPFGVRNVLFTAAGMSKMPFRKFIFCDLVACLFSNSALFFLAYTLGKNYHKLLFDLKIFNILIFTAFVVTLIAFIWYYRRKKRKNLSPNRIRDSQTKDF